MHPEGLSPSDTAATFFFPHSFFRKDDTAKQTPLNNENMLSGSNASLAQAVSCQTVNKVLKWRGRALKGGGCAVALQPYNII